MKKEIWNWVAYLGDCLEVMEKLIEQWIKVDVIICDPPYNLTACAWDKLIPFDKMWEKLNKLIKPNWAIVLFGSEPFSSALRMSNIKNYKYDWIWEKSIPSWWISSKYQPMKKHEIVSIFATGKTIFNWIKEKRAENVHLFDKWEREYNLKTEHNWAKKVKLRNQDILRNPTTILKFNNVSRWDSFHPTQKPVALLEYLIKTYTNEWELVLDFTSWSWTTWVACQNLNRQFIMIEKDTEYFNIGTQRILNLIK
jgi:DNA modification methylase